MAFDHWVTKDYLLTYLRLLSIDCISCTFNCHSVSGWLSQPTCICNVLREQLKGAFFMVFYCNFGGNQSRRNPLFVCENAPLISGAWFIHQVLADDDKITRYSSPWTYLTTTGTHMPYGITQCYLPPGRGDIPPLPQPGGMHVCGAM